MLHKRITHRFFLLWITCWLVFNFIALPFPYQILPQVGVQIATFVLPLNKLFGILMGIDISNSYHFSDSVAFYATAIFLLPISFIFALILTGKKHEIHGQFHQWIFLSLSVFVSYFLIHYGLDKLFELQFYTPASNTLHTRIGQLDKDLLFWTAMGTSQFYNHFMGLTELIAGAFLFFDRTRFLGYLCAFGLFLHVFAINIGFDISVKFLSGLLLFSSFIGLVHYKTQLLFLVGIHTTETDKITFSTKLMRVAFIPFAIELLVVFSSVSPKTNGESFVVLKTEADFPVTQINRVHIHPENFLIVETTQGDFHRFKLNAEKTHVQIQGHFQPFNIHADCIKINGKIVFKVKKIRLENLPLLQDKTHLFSENYAD